MTLTSLIVYLVESLTNILYLFLLILDMSLTMSGE